MKWWQLYWDEIIWLASMWKMKYRANGDAICEKFPKFVHCKYRGLIGEWLNGVIPLLANSPVLSQTHILGRGCSIITAVRWSGPTVLHLCHCETEGVKTKNQQSQTRSTPQLRLSRRREAFWRLGRLPLVVIWRKLGRGGQSLTNLPHDRIQLPAEHIKVIMRMIRPWGLGIGFFQNKE